MPRAAVVGTGLVARAHVGALRQLGVDVAGVVGSSPERARASGLAPVYESVEAMLADDVDVVHVTTPNYLHFPQVKAALAAGKHVVCEKPLAMTSEESAELLELARASGLVHCTNFNYRCFPLVQRARALVRGGELGEVWSVHGGFFQDWLLLATDWNWRLQPEIGGATRALSDIGSHWLDAVEFVTGLRVTEVCGDLATVIPVRGEAAMATEDLANVLLRFEGGARGSLVVSQVSAGRSSLRFEVDGSAGALAWDGERADELWLGYRERPNELLGSEPVDTFRELYRAVYARVEAGGTPVEPTFPTFEDGHRAQVVVDAVAESHRRGAWVTV